MPIYIVRHSQGHPRLVRAPNAAQAIRHVTKTEFTASVVSVDEGIKLSAAGVKVEEAGALEADPTDLANLNLKFPNQPKEGT